MSSAVVVVSFSLDVLYLYGGGNFNIPVYLKYFSDMLGMNKVRIYVYDQYLGCI